MIPVCFFQMMGVCVTLSWLIIQSSEAITFLKEYIQSYKTPQISPLTKWIGGLIMKQFLEVTGDKGVIIILMNPKHKVLVAEARLPNSKYVTLHENYLMWDQCQISPIRYDGGPTTNKKLHPHLSINFVQEFGGGYPTPKYVKDVSTYFKARKYRFCQRPIGILQSPSRRLYLIYSVVVDSNPSKTFLGRIW